MVPASFRENVGALDTCNPYSYCYDNFTTLDARNFDMCVLDTNVVPLGDGSPSPSTTLSHNSSLNDYAGVPTSVREPVCLSSFHPHRFPSLTKTTCNQGITN